MALADRIVLQGQVNRMAVMAHMAAQLDLTDPVMTRMTLKRIEPYHLGGLDRAALNGGVIAAMLDGAMVTAGMLQFPGRTCATVELGIKMLRPAFGRDAVAIGMVIRRTARLAFVIGELYDETHHVCAMATGVVATIGRLRTSPVTELR